MGSAEAKPWISLLAAAAKAASHGDWAWTESWCDLILASHSNNGLAVLDVGALHSQVGNLEKAEAAFGWAHQLLPDDARPLVNLANCWQGSLRQQEALTLYGQITARWPDDNRHWHNHLMALAYEPSATATDAKKLAKQWADQLPPAVLKPIDFSQRKPLEGRKLRLGFLSADFCQHTVGLLLLPVIEAHDRDKFALFFYSASPQWDWVSKAIQACGAWRDIEALDAVSVAKKVRTDEIDVLIELGGHTAGTRLPVLHQRAAPVQLSWLGYWGSTGLERVDGVILDHETAPLGSEVVKSFGEPILRMQTGRWCYKPVPWMAKACEPPYLKNGFITFGSFNNTAKINRRLIDIWAEILQRVPDSRMVLKWKTLRDDKLKERLRDAFTRLGVSKTRIELRGASFHGQMLEEYADVDIALDPFPFGGGLTSLESLWLGLPLVTLRCHNSGACVAGLQGTALLESIGKGEWIAENEQDYITIAVNLANKGEGLKGIRSNLAETLGNSNLCNGTMAWESLTETINEAIKSKTSSLLGLGS